MERNNLIKQLKSLSKTNAGGQCREAWVRDTRAVLMEKVERDAKAMPVGEAKQLRIAVDMGTSWQKMMRPVMAMAAIVVLIFGSSIATVSASYDSLPGDTLYSVKIFSEGAQLSLAANKENKTKMRMDFAGRRLDEVAKLIESLDPDKDKKIDEAVGHFKKNIAGVNKGLDEIRQTKSTKIVEVAKDVDRKAEEYEETIQKTIGKVSDGAKKGVKEARTVVEEVGVKAVEVLVEKHMKGEAEGVTEDEIIEKLNNKIQRAEENIAEVKETGGAVEADDEDIVDGEESTEEIGDEIDGEESTEEIGDEENVEESSEEESDATATDEADGMTQQAENKVEEAKVLLGSKDLLGALGAVKEATTLTSAAGVEADAAAHEAEAIAEEASEEGDSTSSTEEIVEEPTEEEQSTTTTEEIISEE